MLRGPSLSMAHAVAHHGCGVKWGGLFGGGGGGGGGGVGVGDDPEVGFGVDGEGAAVVGAGEEVVAGGEDEVGADGGVGDEVVVSVAADVGDSGIDDLDGFEFLEGGEFLGAEHGGDVGTAEASEAAEEPVGDSEELVFFADVEDETFGIEAELGGGAALEGDIEVHVWGGEDDGAELELFAGGFTGGDIFNVEFAEGGGEDVGAAAVADDVDLLDVGAGGDELEGLLEVIDGEFAGLAVVHVLFEAGAAGGPGVGDGDAFAAEEMPDLGDARDGVDVLIVDAVDGEVDFLAGGVGEHFGEGLGEFFFGGELVGVVLFFLVGAGHLEEIAGSGLEPSEFGGFWDGDVEVDVSPVGGAGFDELIPGDVVAEFDLGDAEGHGAGAAVAVFAVVGGIVEGDTIGEVEDIDGVGAELGGDVGEGILLAGGIEVGGGHELLLGASGEEGGGEGENCGSASEFQGEATHWLILAGVCGQGMANH